MIKAGAAIEKSNMFTFDGSLAKGRAMTTDLAKLMLRAYNAEAENVVRTLRAGNTVTVVIGELGDQCRHRGGVGDCDAVGSRASVDVSGGDHVAACTYPLEQRSTVSGVPPK